jgi:hypothetical protein
MPDRPSAGGHIEQKRHRQHVSEGGDRRRDTE